MRDKAVPRMHRFLEAQALSAALPPLLVAAERVAATVAQGVHGRRRTGQGETFWQFRRYQPGDPTTRIDWRRSAKSDRIYIRQTEWEAAQSVWLWRDASPSMDYRAAAARPTKRHTAEVLLLALASLLVRGGEHLSLLGDATPPSSGRATLERLAFVLGRAAADGAGLPAQLPLPRDARVVMFGDWLSPLDRIRAAIRGFSSRGVRGHLVQIIDPAEASLPFSGHVVFDGPEGEGIVRFGEVASVRERYVAAFAAHQRGLQAVAQSMGWTLLIHSTDRPLPATLMALYLILADQSGG